MDYNDYFTQPCVNFGAYELLIRLRDEMVKNVKEEIRNKIARLENENAELKKYKDEYLKVKSELSKVQLKLKEDREAFEKEKANYSLNDLIKNRLIKAYRVDGDSEYKTIEFLSPSGRKLSEEQVVGKTYSIKEIDAVGLSASVKHSRDSGIRESKVDVYFQFVNHQPNSWLHLDLNKVLIFDTFNDLMVEHASTELENYWNFYFSTKEEAEKYKAYLEKEWARKQQGNNNE